jgi:hypothetical protein
MVRFVLLISGSQVRVLHGSPLKSRGCGVIPVTLLFLEFPISVHSDIFTFYYLQSFFRTVPDKFPNIHTHFEIP